MTLTKKEFSNLEYLLGKAEVEGLSPSEENNLRNYISKERPSAQNVTSDDLVNLGLILVGAYLVSKWLESK